MKKTVFITSLAALILEAMHQLLSLICGYSMMFRMQAQIPEAQVAANTTILCAVSTLVKAILPLAVVILTFILVSRMKIRNYISEIAILCGIGVIVPLGNSLIGALFSAMFAGMGTGSTIAYSYYTSGSALPAIASSMAMTLATIACTISICKKVAEKKAAKQN